MKVKLSDSIKNEVNILCNLGKIFLGKGGIFLNLLALPSGSAP